MYPLSLNIGGMGFLRGAVHAEAELFPVHPNARSPFALLFLIGHTKPAMRRLRSCLAHVLHVLPGRGEAKIRQSIVRTNPVDVVYSAGREMSVDHKPDEPMRSVDLPVGHEPNVAFVVRSSSNPSIFLGPRKPSQNACFWIVGKKLKRTSASNIRLSHDAPQMLIGQSAGGASITTMPTPILSPHVVTVK